MRFLPAALVLSGCLLGPSWCRAESDADPSHAELVERLGHPEYAERRDARRRLLSAGLAAFDALRAGRDRLDPEVADASASLLRELTTDWAWAGDPARVRQTLVDFDGLPAGSQRVVLEQLAALPYQEGVPALVRLARFAPSDPLARQAAVTLLAGRAFEPDPRRLEALGRAVDDLNARFGPATRDGPLWLEQAIGDSMLGEASGDSLEAWERFAERERGRLERGRGESSVEVMATLGWCWLRAALVADEAARALAAVRSLESVDPDQAAERVLRATQWAIEAERVAIGDALVEAFGPVFEDKRGLYVLAELADARGESQRTVELAAEALSAEVGDLAETLVGPRVVVGQELIQRGRREWALAEYRAAVAAGDPLDGEAVAARGVLAERLFDEERYTEAAELLGELIDAIEAEPGGKKRYAGLPQARGFAALRARERLSAALAARASGDREVELIALREAIAADLKDADVVIAMHRVTDPPPALVQETERHIERLCRRFEEEIWDPDTSGARARSAPYNQWAWLVSNTEGDFAKAVRYSRTSLRLMPETGGYLDTLGRCLFSAGRLEEAVEAQRRAVELEPHLLVMRRQLAEFEAALAAQEASR